MPQIMEIRKLPGGRCLICLEDGHRFPLYGRELSEYGICEGEILSDESLRSVLGELLPKRARLRAMHLLEAHDWTEYQLREKLALQFYPCEMIDDVIDYVKAYHYIDDLRYATNYLEVHGSDKSFRQMEQELYQKGVSREIVQEARAAVALPDEEIQIRALLAKKHYDPETCDQKERQRIWAFLLRRGYSMENVSRALHQREA